MSQKERALQKKIFDKLEQKYGVGKVWNRGGVGEHGVDIIFAKGPDATGENTNEFGETQYIGIQLKVVESMDSTKTQTAIGQATVALGHRFPLNRDGVYLHMVYIMNDGYFTTNAEEYLADARASLNSIDWFNKDTLSAYLQSGAQSTSAMNAEDEDD